MEDGVSKRARAWHAKDVDPSFGPDGVGAVVRHDADQRSGDASVASRPPEDDERQVVGGDDGTWVDDDQNFAPQK